MTQHTLMYNDASLIFRRRTVRDNLMLRVVFRALNDRSQHLEVDTLELECWSLFADFLIRVTVEGDIGIEQPSVNADPDTLWEAYEAFMAAPGELGTLIEHGLLRIDAPINDPDLSPDVPEKKVKKKVSK